jgi:hypothetical protein
LLVRFYPISEEVSQRSGGVFLLTYDENGARRGLWTAKSRNKTAARNYCHKLIKKGALIPDRRKAMTFGEFAEGFWDKGSEYVEYRDSRVDITDSYLSLAESPPLDKITAAYVNFSQIMSFPFSLISMNHRLHVRQYLLKRSI